ncbi:putative glucose-methanol-choline oxidoreductase, protein Hothead [Helianthus annuus]|nr:putative glucose-methanol-choline oxidoreductase, protein Hothead [Helianthus annuus]KAJ0755851.1 putative glucose-methanol-choline oxidoreductase, protein Hothead [Helianthus annuus]
MKMSYKKLSLFIFLFSSCLATLLTPSHGDYKHWQTQFSFIRRASSFSSPSSSSNQGEKGYDYIVVGGGTAGCPLAATLSQKYNVLLLERGGVPFTNRNVSFLSNFHLTLADTSNTSPSQYFVSNDGVYNARARVLGGGTSINAGFYTRASARYNSL